MCKNKQKPELEQCYEKESFRAGVMFRKRRALEPEQCHLYDSSTALHITTLYSTDLNFTY